MIISPVDMSVISPTFAKKVYSLNESKDKRNLLKTGFEGSRIQGF